MTLNHRLLVRLNCLDRTLSDRTDLGRYLVGKHIGHSFRLQFDIDHRDRILHTSKDIDDFRLTIQKSEIQKLIVGDRVVIRFEGVRDSSGLSMPDSSAPVMGELTGIGVQRFDFDYTND